MAEDRARGPARGAESDEEAPQQRTRGLPAIEQARQERATKVRFPRAKFWAYAGLVLAVALIFHWKNSQREDEHARSSLLSQQRVVKGELGPKWFPVRDRIERWTLELVKSAGDEVVDKQALAGWDFRVKSGIYLRMRIADVVDAGSIRKGAKESLKDAFTSCLTRAANPNQVAGIECKHTRDCPSGEHCNETDHCSKPAQPFNVRVAYKTMHVLTDDWVRDVQDANSDIALRMLNASFEDTLRDDIPYTTQLLAKAEYYLLVLDEGAAESVDGGAEALQAVPHQARIGLWRLADDKLVLRLRREAGGTLIGGMPAVDERVMAATHRQANSCALAMSVRQAMGDVDVPVGEPAAK